MRIGERWAHILSFLLIGIFLSESAYAYDSYGVMYSSCCSISFLLLGIIFAAWTYGDAKKRGMSAGLWALIVFFLGIVGLLIYLIVRKPKISSTYYTNQQVYSNTRGYAPPPPPPAQQSYNINQAIAPSTGETKVIYKEREIVKEIVKVKCPYCGALVEQGKSKCPNCGAPLR